MKTLTLVALALLSAPACSSYSSYRYGPALQDVLVRTNDGSEVIASALVSSRGIAEKDEGNEVRFRLRLQNHRSGPLVVAGAELVDANLNAFGPARIAPPPVPIEPGAEAVHELAFPFPSGRAAEELDLSALNLRVTLREGNESWAWSAGFERMITDVYDPYWYPYDPYWGHPWHFGFHTGVVWCD